MYIETGAELNRREVYEALVERMREYNIKIENTIDIDYIAQQFVDLNSALLRQKSGKQKQVWAVCVKYPIGSLDKGRHYFDIYYINENGEPQKFWLYHYIKAFNGISQNRHSWMSKYIWCSGAIGMSRLLDATDSIFSFIKKMGGCYSQIDLL